MTRYEIDKVIEHLREYAKTIEARSIGKVLAYVELDDIEKAYDADISGDYLCTTEVGKGITLDDVVTILSDGLADANAFDDVDYDNNEYYRAREDLLQHGFTEGNLCLEAVQANMLYMGFSLKLHEAETNKWHELTLKNMLDGIEKSLAGIIQSNNSCTRLRAMHILFDEGDFYDYEGVLQNAIFGEVVCG